MLRKCICMIVTVALVVCVSVAPVGATDVSGFLFCDLYFHGDSVALSFPRAGVNTPVFSSVVSFDTSTNTRWIGVDNIIFDVSSFDVSPGGSIGVYFSWAVAVDVPFSSYVSDLGYSGVYSVANTSSYVFDVQCSEFNFSHGVSGLYDFPGVQLSARIDDVDVLTALEIHQEENGFVGYFESPYTGELRKNWYVPSISLIATQSSVELDALESVANQIAEGNDLARAHYGAVIAALNALKSDTELMASYINDCLIYLGSIENATIKIHNLCETYLQYLAQIASTAEDIEAELEAFHTDFMSKLDLLISTIVSESDDIQATMDRIYDQLIAWMETNFKEAISPEFEGSNSDLKQGIANNDAIEQQWTGSLSDTWTAMHIADFSFDPSFTSGFMWVSGWFSNIYNSLGLYGSIVILPLIIGICKLLLGYFRFSGHGHLKGGDDSA